MEDVASDVEKEGDQNAFLIKPSREKRISIAHNRRVLFFVALVTFSFAVTIGLALGLGLSYGFINSNSSSSSGVYQHAAVATDAPQCSKVGVDILRKGGSAVDAAIASLLCVGVVNLQSTGIGGGGFLVYYNATSQNATVIDHREKAPAKANSSMYDSFGSDEQASIYGENLIKELIVIIIIVTLVVGSAACGYVV